MTGDIVTGERQASCFERKLRTHWINAGDSKALVNELLPESTIESNDHIPTVVTHELSDSKVDFERQSARNPPLKT